MLVFEGRGNRSTRRKPLGAEQRTNKLNPHLTPDLGIEPGPHWWEASALTTAPSLHIISTLSANKVYFLLTGHKQMSSTCPQRQCQGERKERCFSSKCCFAFLSVRSLGLQNITYATSSFSPVFDSFSCLEVYEMDRV